MARCVDPNLPGPVIELGPGTGPVTEALLRRGISADRLILVEFDVAFCKLLARRYPGCRIVQGDAYSLGRTLRDLVAEPAAAVVSSLPLLNRPESERSRLLADAFALMHPDAPFVQFTYGLLSPMPKQGEHATWPYQAKASAPVWLNLPPARVWVYRPARRLNGHALEQKPDLLDKLKAGGEKIGIELREQRERLRMGFVVRSSEARSELKARTDKVKLRLEREGARLKAVRAARLERAERFGDKRHHW